MDGVKHGGSGMAERGERWRLTLTRKADNAREHAASDGTTRHARSGPGDVDRDRARAGTWSVHQNELATRREGTINGINCGEKCAENGVDGRAMSGGRVTLAGCCGIVRAAAASAGQRWSVGGWE